MRLVVPDASVILKWVLPSGDEPDAMDAIRLRDSIAAGKLAMRVPSLWLYEVGNILSRNLSEHAVTLLESLVAFGMPAVSEGEQWRRQAVTLTQQLGVTFYDAAYHASAIVERGTFITADSRYFAKARTAGSVLLLSDYWK